MLHADWRGIIVSVRDKFPLLSVVTRATQDGDLLLAASKQHKVRSQPRPFFRERGRRSRSSHEKKEEAEEAHQQAARDAVPLR
jgi:hypothetical protein